MDELKYCLLIGILANHGISAQKAWELPTTLKQRMLEIDSCYDSLSKVDQLTVEQVIELFNQSPKLHRFNNKMAMYVHELIATFNQQYNGNFSLLLPIDDNQQIIANVSKLPGMSQNKAKHLIVYLVAIDNAYSLTGEEYLKYTTDCPQLVERFDYNLKILCNVQ